MPLTKSAKKALLVSKRRKIENDLTRAKVKGALKGAKIAIRENKKDVSELVSAAYRELDMAAKKNVIHKNKAARLKSRLVKKIAKIETPVKPVKAVKAVAEKKVAVKAKKPATRIKK